MIVFSKSSIVVKRGGGTEGVSLRTPFTMIHPGLFHTFSFFRHPRLVKSDFFQLMGSLGTPLKTGEGTKPYILVEFNPNILVRDIE